MSLRDDILEAQIQAMREKQSMRNQTLRMLLSSIKNEEIEKKEQLTDGEVQKVVARHVKQLEDSIKDFEKGGRHDLVQSAKDEVEIYKVYLPEQLSDEALEKIVLQVIETAGATGPGDIGKAMGMVMKEVAGTADGNRVRDMVQKKLQS